jgi:hypothetical protein
VTVDGPLETLRESEAPPSEHVVKMVEASAKKEGKKSPKPRRSKG